MQVHHHVAGRVGGPDLYEAHEPIADMEIEHAREGPLPQRGLYAVEVECPENPGKELTGFPRATSDRSPSVISPALDQPQPPSGCR